MFPPTVLCCEKIVARSRFNVSTRTETDHVPSARDGAAPATALPKLCADLGVAALAAGTAVFCVVLVDAAGHRGDGDCTKAITLAQKAECAKCERDMEPGEHAHLGLSDEPVTPRARPQRIFVCDACVPRK